jgi:hypothetical protein
MSGFDGPERVLFFGRGFRLFFVVQKWAALWIDRESSLCTCVLERRVHLRWRRPQVWLRALLDEISLWVMRWARARVLIVLIIGRAFHICTIIKTIERICQGVSLLSKEWDEWRYLLGTRRASLLSLWVSSLPCRQLMHSCSRFIMNSQEQVAC